MMKTLLVFPMLAGVAMLVSSDAAIAQGLAPLQRAPQAQVTTLTVPGPYSEPSVAVNPRKSAAGGGRLPGSGKHSVLD